MTKEIVFFREFHGEEICDIDRDISEMFDSRMNPAIDKAKVGEHGIHEGKFRVSVVWCSEDDCDCIGFGHKDNCRFHWTNDPDGEVPY